MFDSIQVEFKNTKTWPSPFADTKVVPFEQNYLEVLKKVVQDVKTEYFWFFANFINMKTIDVDFIPPSGDIEMHVWYNTHPKGGTNKEGNVFLIPTEKFKDQCNNIKLLKDFSSIQYYAHNNLFQNIITKTAFDLSDPYEAFMKQEPHFYVWLKNKTCEADWPNFYPSFWEGIHLYSWGATHDIILAPIEHKGSNIHFYDYEYETRPMDVVKVKSNSKLGFVDAATTSKTEYFFALLPDTEIKDKKILEYQPNRLAKPCHYIFDDAVYLCNKKLVLDPKNPGLDLKLGVKINGV